MTIRALHRARRVDSLSNQGRRGGRRLGRLVYLAILVGLALVLADAILGPRLFLRADGMLLQSRHVVASTSTVRIVALNVAPGAYVHEGQVLAQAQSREIIEAIADLTVRKATLMSREAEIDGKAAVHARLLPLARRRAAEAERMREAMEQLEGKRLVSSAMRLETAKHMIDAEREAAELEAGIAALAGERDGVRNARTLVAKALSELRQQYEDGRLTAPASGYIGPRTPNLGEVVKAGEPILEVLAGRPYVLAYVPPERLYGLAEGDEVIVSSGYSSIRGHVETVRFVSDAVPEEFRRTFAPLQRQQLVRIALEEAPPIPILSTVTVSGRNSLPGLATALGLRLDKRSDIARHQMMERQFADTPNEESVSATGALP